MSGAYARSRWIQTLTTLAVVVSGHWLGHAADGREWSDASGQYRTDAELTEFKGDTVRLTKKDGATVSLPLERLSENDQRYVMRWMPERIATDVGNVSRFSRGSEQPWVVVFPETHVSRLGQIEIALMMFRLHRDHGMRHIALEGHVEDAPADAVWFHTMPVGNRLKHRVAVRLLEEGEISAAEFMALICPKVVLMPIEKSAEYSIEMEDGAIAGPIVYLFRMALMSLRDVSDIRKVNELAADKEKTTELLDYVIKADPWTAEKHKLLTQDGGKILQAEQFIELVEAIEERAEQVGYEPEKEERESLRQFGEFFRARDAASETMVSATATIAQQYSRAPIAMSIGAAHVTKVCMHLDSRNLGYVVVQPRSLETEFGQMSLEAFVRKGKKLSVDVNKIGAWLDDRGEVNDQKKPPPVLSEHWLQAKSALYSVADLVAEAAAAGEGRRTPPFGFVGKELDLGPVRVDPASIKIVDGNVVFKVLLFHGLAEERREGDEDDMDKWSVLWGRAKYVGEEPEIAEEEEYDADIEIERMLKERLTEVSEEPVQDKGTEEESEDHGGPRSPVDREKAEDSERAARGEVTPSARVSSKTIALFSRSETAMLRTAI